ncbi:pyrroline-5-carboxylate reductase [Pseudolysinimonas kribbensis]|uniref:Pyrroline-5-carboxylate reductase n=1 Tax=Pseudolysinimonas kribbensis TaxID=433641 RepID=A0ABQ6K5I0_9MICO|nr:pyrroline-5-carboxylate reductase [Pseudolysinimonas kribbensis]GMA94818.1 pyrroline-5-carboxylate reductase [Pseudolysinimonas kribbensis]
MSPSLPRIALLGAGSMGGALLAGLIASGVGHGGVTVTNRTAAKAAALGGPGVTSLALERDPDAQRTALDGARLVVLGVKPAMIPELLTSIRTDLDPDAVVVSVAAGVTIASMEALVPNPVLRAMPNTPAVVRLGVTGLASGPRVSAEQTAVARAFFETSGAVVEVPEDRIDALSTISGSGPAYVFLLVESFTATALRMGFSDADARLMVQQTFRGASELLAASDVDPAELRRRVTSPKGTTERAIAVLEEADLTGLFDRATAAALDRARELAHGDA